MPSSATTKGGSHFALAALWVHRHVSSWRLLSRFGELGATIEGRSVVTAGRYSVWFKTQVGEGAGVVELASDGQLHGTDSTFAYAGHWEQEGGRLQAKFSARRTTPGPPGVFGMDELDLTVTGYCNDDGSVSCTGFAKQSPGLRLELTLLRIGDD